LSIQSQLIKLIISLVTIATFIAAMHGYRNSQQQLNTVLDTELKTLANFILSSQQSQLNKDAESQLTDVVTDSDYFFSNKAYQVFSNDGQLLARSNNAPAQAISSSDGFSEEAFAGARWRTYLYANDDAYVIVAQSDNYRRNVSEEILLATIVPIVFSIPVIGLLIFYIIRKSLGPLHQLSAQLNNKHSEDLTGVYISLPSKELNPVVDKLNALFNRLSSSFELEKQLSANAAHELRTPISVLAIAANNLVANFDKGRLTHEHFDELNQNVARMAQVIEQIIALFRFSSDTIGAEKTVVNVQKVLQQVISNNYLSIEKENQTIELDASKTCVLANEFSLYVLFENLVRNANKYGGKNCQIYIKLTDEKSNVMVDVHDSGEGLSDAEISQLTQRFYRAQNQTNIKGSGLGLAISKHIVNLHQGKLAFLSSPYGGLDVRVSLPKSSANVA